MNTRGRAAICGAISHYNEVGGYSKTTDILPLCIFKELMVEGFLVGRWKPRWVEGIEAMAGWVASGKIKVRETVVDGFLVGRWKPRWVEGIEAMAGWVASGKI